MSKRTATQLQSTNDGQPYAKASRSGSKREAIPEDEMGEFEDAWEDEIEEDEIGEDQDPNGVLLSFIRLRKYLLSI